MLPSIISSMLGDSVDKHGNISDEERIKIIAATMYIGAWHIVATLINTQLTYGYAQAVQIRWENFRLKK